MERITETGKQNDKLMEQINCCNRDLTGHDPPGISGD